MGFSIPKYCAGFHFLLQGIFSTQGSKPHISCSGRHILSFQHHSMVTLIFSNLRNFQTVCQSDSIVLHPQQQVIEGSDFSTFWPIVISIYHLFYFSTLVGVQWCLTVILICISAMTRDVEELFIAYWQFFCLLWRNVCVDLVPMY